MHGWRVLGMTVLNIWRVFFSTLASVIVLTEYATAQEPPVKPTMFFIWAEDTEDASANRFRGLGSGFLASSDGHIITAKHVIEGIVQGERIVVAPVDKSRPTISIDNNDISCANNADICVVRVRHQALPPDAQVAANLVCNTPVVGTNLAAMGFLGGSDLMAGVDFVTGKVTGTPIGGGLVPTDITAVPTMSGGPVFLANDVIGVIHGGLTSSSVRVFYTPVTRMRSNLINLGIDCGEVAVGPSVIVPPPSITPTTTLTNQVVDDEILFQLSKSPYKIDGDYQISPNGTISIEKGVVIDFTEGSTLTVFGTIQAIGSETNPITVRGTSSNDRQGIRLYSRFPEDSSLKFVNFERQAGLTVGFNIGKAKNQLHPSPEIKNTVEISNVSFIRSFLIGEWGSDHIKINLDKAIFDDSHIHAQYPYSPEIDIGRSTFSYTKITSDNYARRGIHIFSSKADDVDVVLGCCSAQLSLSDSDFTNTVFSSGNGSPVNGNIKIIDSVMTNIDFNLPQSTLITSGSNIVQLRRDFSDIGIHAGIAKMSTTCLSGFSRTTALSIHGNHDRRGESSLDEVSISTSKDGVFVDGGDGFVAYDLAFYKIANLYVRNETPMDIRVRNLIHDGGNAVDRIYDFANNFSSGKVIVRAQSVRNSEPVCPS